MVGPVELLKKLQVKSGTRLWLINVPETIAEALTAGTEVEPVRQGDPFDGAIAFCANPAEVAPFAGQILAHLPEDGLLWFAYRKGAAAKASGLSRDTGWEPLKAQGLDTVRSVAIDDEWTGLRFRPVRAIKRA